MREKNRNSLFNCRKSIWSRLLTVLLCMAMIAGSLPVTALASETIELGDQLPDDQLFEEDGGEEESYIEEADHSALNGSEEIPEEEGSVEADEESLEEESLSEDGEYVQEALPDDDTEMLLPEVEEAEEEAETDGEGPVTLTVNLAWVDYYEDTVHNDVTMVLEKRVGNKWVDEGRKLILNDKNEWQSSLIVDGNPKDFRFVEEDDEHEQMAPYDYEIDESQFRVQLGASTYIGNYSVRCKVFDNLITTFTNTLNTDSYRVKALWGDDVTKDLQPDFIMAELQSYKPAADAWSAVGEQKKLNAASRWTAVFKKIPILKTEDGELIYRIRQINGEGRIIYSPRDADRQDNAAVFYLNGKNGANTKVTYKSVVHKDAITALNTETTVKYSNPEVEKNNKNGFTVKVVWDDNEHEFDRYTTIKAALLKKNGNGWDLVEDLEISSDDGWVKSFAKVEVKEGDEYRILERDGRIGAPLLEEGQIGVFAVSEKTESRTSASYIVSYQRNGGETIITNTLHDSTQFSVEMNWRLGGYKENGVSHEGVPVVLRRKEGGVWVVKEEITLSDANNWKGTFQTVSREAGDEWDICEKDPTGRILAKGDRGKFPVVIDGEQSELMYIPDYFYLGSDDYLSETGIKVTITNNCVYNGVRFRIRKVWEDHEAGLVHDPVRVILYMQSEEHIGENLKIGETLLSEENHFEAELYSKSIDENDVYLAEEDSNGELTYFYKGDGPKGVGVFKGRKGNESFEYTYIGKSELRVLDYTMAQGLEEAEQEYSYTLTNTKSVGQKNFSTRINGEANLQEALKPVSVKAWLQRKKGEWQTEQEVILNEENNWEMQFDPIAADEPDENYRVVLVDYDNKYISSYRLNDNKVGVFPKENDGVANFVSFDIRVSSVANDRIVFNPRLNGRYFRVAKFWKNVPEELESISADILLQHRNQNGEWTTLDNKPVNFTTNCDFTDTNFNTDNNFRIREKCVNAEGPIAENGGTIVLTSMSDRERPQLYRVEYGSYENGKFYLTNTYQGLAYPASVQWDAGAPDAGLEVIVQYKDRGDQDWSDYAQSAYELNANNNWAGVLGPVEYGNKHREFRVRAKVNGRVIEEGGNATIENNQYVFNYNFEWQSGKTVISTRAHNKTYNVNAVWDVGALNVDNNTAPGPVSVKLQHRENNNWTDKETKVLNADNHWQCTFEAAGDRDDNYRVVEVDRSNNVIKNGDRGVFNVRVNGREEGYDFNASVQFRAPQENEEGNGTFTIRNTFATQMITYRVTAKWEDENDRDDKRPDSIRVLLKAANRDNKELTLSGAGNVWNGSFAAVPERINGQAVNYSIDYNVPADYDYCNVLQDEDDDKKYVLTFVHHHKDDEEDENNNNQNNPDPNNPNVNPPGIGGVEIGAAFGKIAPYLAIGAAGAIIGTLGGLGGGGGDNNDGDDPDEKITVSGKLRWNHGNNPRDNWPGNVTVQLLADGAPVKDNYKYLDVNEDADYTSYSFNDVPKYNGAKVINYSVTTDTIKDYTAEYDGMNVTLTYTPGKTYRKVSLGWNDQNNWDGIRPQSVDVNLLSGGTTIETMRLSAENNWTDTFADLDDTEDGYSVEVVQTDVITGVDGKGTYTYNIEGTDDLGFFIRLTHTSVNTAVTGRITWDDDNDRDKKRPDSVTVTLMARLANGETVDMTTVKDRSGNYLPGMKKTVTADDDWRVTFTFEKAPMAADGGRITWFLKQDPVSEYDTTIDGMNAINIHRPAAVSLSGTVTWDDYDDLDGIRPESVTIRVLADGEQMEDVSAETTAKQKWTWSITGLPMYQDGKEISYSVTEEATTVLSGEDGPGTYAFEVNMEDAVHEHGKTKGILIKNKHLPNLPVFTTHSLILSGSIGINFFMNLPEAENIDYSDSYVEFNVNDRITKDYLDPKHRDASGKGYYGFTTYVTSVEMAEPITAIFHYKRLQPGEGGTEVKEEYVKNIYSVKDYIIAYEEVQDQYDAQTTALVRAMADYGHYVQPVLARNNHWTIGREYKEMDKYYTDSFDYGAVENAVAGFEIMSDLGDSGFTKMTYSINLLSRTQVYIYLYYKEGFSGIEEAVSDWSPVTPIHRPANNCYVLITSASFAFSMDERHDVIVKTASGTASIAVSPLDYIHSAIGPKNKADNRDAASAIYYYYEKARAYRSTH